MAKEAERKAIAGRAGIIGLGTLASRFLGLGRDVTLAASFTLAQTDAFWIAFTLPNAFRQLLAEGAVNSAVLPVLTEVREKEGDEAARRFFARTRGLSLVALGVVSLLGVVFAEPLVRLFAGGFADRPGQIERTVLLTRWVFPYLFFMGTAALGVAALHTYKRFVVASFAPALLNVAFIGCSFGIPAWLARNGHDPTLALAAAVLLGGFLQMAAQVPSLRAIGFVSLPRFDFRDPHVRTVVRRIGPMALGLGIYYVDLVVCRRLLSGQGEGAQSYFAWAQRLCDFPQGIFVMALSAATLPSLASLAAKGEHDELGRTVAFGVGLSLFVAIPVAVAFFVLGEPLVVALFQRGKFDAHAAAETAKSLRYQGLGIVSVAVVRQLVPAFFALGDTRSPVVVSGLDLLALVVMAYLLTGPFGHVGVSMAVAGSSTVQMMLLAVALRSRIPTMTEGLGGSIARTAAASAVGGVAGYGALWVGRGLLHAGPIGRLLPAASSGLVFGVAFVLVAWLLGSRELLLVSNMVRRKLGRTKPAVGLHSDDGQSRRPHGDRCPLRRGSHSGLHSPRGHCLGDRLRGPVERRQIEPAEHAHAAQEPGPDELHARLHTRHQHLRSDLRRRPRHASRRSPGLRLRQPLEAGASVVGPASRGVPPRAAHAAGGRAPGRRPARHRKRRGRSARVSREREPPLAAAAGGHPRRHEARQGSPVSPEDRSHADALPGTPRHRLLVGDRRGPRRAVAEAAPRDRRGQVAGRSRSAGRRRSRRTSRDLSAPAARSRVRARRHAGSLDGAVQRAWWQPHQKSRTAPCRESEGGRSR
jgi:putative peptidoglycan lipid II flippase